MSKPVVFFASATIWSLLFISPPSPTDAQTFKPPQQEAPSSAAMTEDPDRTAEPRGSEVQIPRPEVQPPALLSEKSNELVIASQGGAYQESQTLAFFNAFQRETGIAVKAINAGGHEIPLEKLLSNSPAIDVVDLPRTKAREACEQGKLEKLDVEGLLGSGARQDFVAGVVDDCGLPSTAWSALFVYDTRAFPKRTPQTLQDVFDTSRFAGKRALPKQPRFVLEMALRADGVPAEEIYRVLETPEGLSRALARLDRIKSHIVWWDNPAEAMKLLQRKHAAVALTFNGRAFFSVVRDRQPFAIIWSGQVVDFNVWAILKESRNKAQAREFLNFALDPKRLSQQTRWFPYGPARLSAVSLAGKHAEINMEMLPYLPTAPANFKDAVIFEGAFWAKHENPISARFHEWLVGKIENSGTVAPSAR